MYGAFKKLMSFFQVKKCDGKVFFETLENADLILNLKSVERIFIAVYCNENFVVRSKTGKKEEFTKFFSGVAPLKGNTRLDRKSDQTLLLNTVMCYV